MFLSVVWMKSCNAIFSIRGASPKQKPKIIFRSQNESQRKVYFRQRRFCKHLFAVRKTFLSIGKAEIVKMLGRTALTNDENGKNRKFDFIVWPFVEWFQFQFWNANDRQTVGSLMSHCQIRISVVCLIIGKFEFFFFLIFAWEIKNRKAND